MNNEIHDDDTGENDFITISVGDMHAWILEAMVALSDGLAWHLASKPEEEHPLVMASPAECADAAVYSVLMHLAHDGIAATDDLFDDEDDVPPAELRTENGELVGLDGTQS